MRILSPMMISSPTLRESTNIAHFLAERGTGRGTSRFPRISLGTVVIRALAESCRHDFDAIDNRPHAFRSRDRGLGHLAQVIRGETAPQRQHALLVVARDVF